MKKIITCVVCPMGCSITVEGEGQRIDAIEGNLCPNGKQYAADEFICPRRTVTSSVQVIGAENPVFPVKTSGPVPKDKVQACIEEIKAACVQAPVEMYQVIIQNIAGTDVDVIATASAERM